MKSTRNSQLFTAARKALLLAAVGAGLSRGDEINFYTFDSNATGWYWENWSAAGSTVAFDATQDSAVAGGATSGSMKLLANFTGAGGYQQAEWTVQMASPTDFSNVGAITLDVKVDPTSVPRADGDYGWMEIVLRQGSGWTWTALPGVRLTSTDWQRVTFPIPKGTTVDSIRAVTAKIGENDLLGPVIVNVDNIAHWNTPDDVVVNTGDSKAQDGWYWENWSGTGSVGWDALDLAGRSSSGSFKLDHEFNNAPGSYQQTVFTMPLPAEVNAAGEFSTINLDVKVDASSVARATGDYGYFEVILRNGSGWDWLSTTPVGGGTGTRIKDNDWHHLSLKVPATADKVHHLTFKVGENALLGPVIMNVDNITWTRSTTPPAPPTLSIQKEASGLSLVATSSDQYGRHNIYTAAGANGEFSFINSPDPYSYSFTIKSFPNPATYPGFQAHIFLVPGTPGTEYSPDWNEPTLIFMDIKANANGTAYATFRMKTDQAGNNTELYANGLTTVNSATVLGTWTLTGQGRTFTMTAPDGTVSAPIDIGAEAAALFGEGTDSPPLRVYYGIQPNGSDNIGQAVQVGELSISVGPAILLTDKFNGDVLDDGKWVANATAGGVDFVAAADAGWIVNWTIPDTGFALKVSPTLTSPTWSDLAVTPTTVGKLKQAHVPKSLLPDGPQAFFILYSAP